MLITQLKPKEEIPVPQDGKTVIISCEGCREVCFPEEEAAAMQNEMLVSGTATRVIVTDYVCNPEHLDLQLEKHMAEIESADSILVFACGVGMQTVAARFGGKRVFTACDTLPLPGSQGLTPLEYDCAQCGDCKLNHTGGICPLTACSKGLVNGQCGGAKNGKCEVDGSMDCGWEEIHKRLASRKFACARQDEPLIRDFSL